MKIKIRDVTLELVTGDITDQKVDAIVNAANSELRGGGGVDGAIHRRGGPEIMAACRKLGACPTGQVRLTAAGRLPSQGVIHAVGPVWRGGGQDEKSLLASAYKQALALARAEKFQSLAFPSLSTGAYGYPIDQASYTALGVVLDFMAQEGPPPASICFVLFSEKDLQAYAQSLQELRPS